MKNKTEMSAAEKKNKKRSGYLFMAAGGMFFLAAFLGDQPSMTATGAVFLAVGAVFLEKSK